MRKFTYLALLCMFVLVNGASAKPKQKLERIEPMFWWTGMENKDLQLLVRGEGIGSTDVAIESSGVSLNKVTRVENKNYLFLDLTITPNAKPGTFDIVFKNKKGKKVLTYPYELKRRDAGSATREGFNSSDLMYLITPDRFANGDTSNDAIGHMQETKVDRSAPFGRHGGDIKGLIENLDYFESMGITALWVNPLLENDGDESSYHGYAITDFYQVDPRYGTNEDYRKLVQESKKRGIKIIADQVENHCGINHWWMKDTPTNDWINYQNSAEFVGTTHARSSITDPYATESDIREFSDGWFVPTMPDLNQRNELLATYLIQNSIWWIEYSGLQGIRQDTYPYPDPEFMGEWTKAIMDEYPNFNIVGEEWSTNPLMVARWQRNNEGPMAIESELPSLMDFPLQDAVAKGLKGDVPEWMDPFMPIYEMLGNDALYPDPMNLVIFPDNHDMDRFYTQVGDNYDLFKVGMTFYYTMRGIPQIYYGTEILASNTGNPHHHGIIRTDFPGGWEGDQKNAFTQEGLSAQEKEAQDFVRKLGVWRKSASAIHSGKLTHYVPKDKTYVYFRMDNNQKVMVVLSLNPEEYELDLARFKETMGSKTNALEVISGKRMDLSAGKLKLPAYGTMIFELSDFL